MPTTHALSIGEYFSGMQKQVWPKLSEVLFHPLDCGIPLWQNPFIILFAAWIFGFLMENILPAMMDYSVLKRKGFGRHLLSFFIDFFIQVIDFSHSHIQLNMFLQI